jgi:DNA-binding beta-propeller fold protein YncE
MNVVISPDGLTAYASSEVSPLIIPISTATNRAGPAIRMSGDPENMGITPDGKTAYLVSYSGHGVVMTLDLATKKPGPLIHVPQTPEELVVTP